LVCAYQRFTLSSENQGVASKTSTVLLVEDSSADLLLLNLAFEKSAIDVDLIYARDGDEALEIVDARFAPDSPEALDLVLLDIAMPGLDGHQTLRQMRMRPHLQGTPIVMLTESRLESDVSTAVELGATSYISKAANLSELYAVVQNISNCWLSKSLKHNVPAA